MVVYGFVHRSALSPRIYQAITKRSFFASSRDHTSLLSSATKHRIDHPDGSKEYINFASNTSLEMALKVNKLHLGRVRVRTDPETNTTVIFDAKVIQKALGGMESVCGPLIDMALNDANGTVEGLASMPELCRWVSKGVDGKESINALQKLIDEGGDQKYFEAIKAIATGIPRPGHSVVGIGTYKDGRDGWINLAMEHINMGHSDQGELYKSRNAKLVGIDYLADDSKDGLISSGGAIARFHF